MFQNIYTSLDYLRLSYSLVRRRSEEEDNHHDIALIRVKDRIVFSDKVTPVNLPSADFDVEIDGECEQAFKTTLVA